MTVRLAAALALSAFLTSPPSAAAQGFKPKKSKIPDADVEKAIEKGIAWLKTARTPGAYHDITSDEIVLYTLFHGGCPKDDPVFQSFLKTVVDKEPSKTYNVALAAMCLSELDKAGYQHRLERYAQFLVDNQCKNGQWEYGSPVPPPPEKPGKKGVATPSAEPGVVVSGPGGGGEGQPAAPPPLYGTQPLPAAPKSSIAKTTALPRRIVLQRGRGPDVGDNSNSQYASLGLRACAEAGIVIDPKCVQDALNYWVKHQFNDGGWTYDHKLPLPRGSMTAGGVGAVAIYRWMLRQPWKTDPAVAKGMQWLHANWDLTKNPKGEDVKDGWAVPWQYYYLYGLERAGMLVGADAIGTHDWYDEGAAYLIKSQQPDGMWYQGKAWFESHGKVWDTCFAILFLRRATKALPPQVYTQ